MRRDMCVGMSQRRTSMSGELHRKRAYPSSHREPAQAMLCRLWPFTPLANRETCIDTEQGTNNVTPSISSLEETLAGMGSPPSKHERCDVTSVSPMDTN